jgi:hypothetical protein
MMWCNMQMFSNGDDDVIGAITPTPPHGSDPFQLTLDLPGKFGKPIRQPDVESNIAKNAIGLPSPRPELTRRSTSNTDVAGQVSKNTAWPCTDLGASEKAAPSSNIGASEIAAPNPYASEKAAFYSKDEIIAAHEFDTGGPDYGKTIRFSSELQPDGSVSHLPLRTGPVIADTFMGMTQGNTSVKNAGDFTAEKGWPRCIAFGRK